MKIVLALGGNALGIDPEDQIKQTKKSAKVIVDLIEDGHQLVLGHGNGPQVGTIISAFDQSSKIDEAIPNMPFAECIAMSQGYIGYHLQTSINSELKKRKIEKSVVTVITEVVVDREDEGFKNPIKPIGSFWTKEEAKKLSRENGNKYIEDAGRGYRRVVPSPSPKEIVEIDSIKSLMDVGKIVITVGGGGIPVYEEKGELNGIDCVIDKDFASAKLAEQLDADYLVILTAVEKVALNFGKENEEWLSELRTKDIDKYIEEGHFAPGSMLSKVEAARDFVNSGKNKKALITSLEKAKEGLKGLTGTVVKK